MLSSIKKTANRSVAAQQARRSYRVELAEVGQHASDGFSRPVGLL